MPRGERSMAGKFAHVITEFLASSKYERLKPATKYNYRHALTLAQVILGPKSIEEIRPSLVQAFLDGLSDFPGKQTNARAAIKALEKWALVRDLLPRSITLGTEAIRSRGGHKPWTTHQIDLAIKHARPDLARAVHLAIETGQRGSDLVKMQWRDLETHNGRLGINLTTKKTTLKLWVPFSLGFAEIIETWEKKLPGFLILSPQARPYSREWLSKEWSLEKATNPNLIELKNLKLTLHGLRASTVIRLRGEGYTTLEIANLIGMSEAMVARYSRFADQIEMATKSRERVENSTKPNVVTLLNKPLKSNDFTV